jgi:hypothetical protein
MSLSDYVGYAMGAYRAFVGYDLIRELEFRRHSIRVIGTNNFQSIPLNCFSVSRVFSEKGYML